LIVVAEAIGFSTVFVSYMVVSTAGDVGWFFVVAVDFVWAFPLPGVDQGWLGDSHVFGVSGVIAHVCNSSHSWWASSGLHFLCGSS